MTIKKCRFLTFLVAFLFVLLPIKTDAKVKAPKKECHAYVVMDAGSGEVLFGQDQDKMIYPASTAKIMTAIVALENGDVNSKFKTEYDVVHGTTLGTYCLGIGANVKYTFKDLLAMSLISSAADATDSLAVGVFGSKAACVEAMNKKCEELGLKNTHFDNPVGSDIGAGYNETYATATEMALITRYAMTKPLIREMVRKSSYTPKGKDITANTTNWFLRGMAWYDKNKYQIIGTKSGTTNAAGHVFIATAKDKKGHEVICAYFGNVSKESTFASIRSLFDYTFSNYKKGKIKLTPANYDIRCSKNFGPIYTKYAKYHCMPGEKDGKFHKNRAITRKQMAKMLKTANHLKERKLVTLFEKSNEKGHITPVDLAKLVSQLYPVHLSDEKVGEILADCSNVDGLEADEKEAFAIFVKEGLIPDKYCKNAKQVITRKEAVLFVDKLNEYQKRYTLFHPAMGASQDEVQVIFTKLPSDEKEEADSTEAFADQSGQVAIEKFYGNIIILDGEYKAKLDQYHAQKEAERAKKDVEKAPEATTQAQASEAATEAKATEATTEAKAAEATTKAKEDKTTGESKDKKAKKKSNKK